MRCRVAAVGIVALRHGLNKAALFVAGGCASGATNARLTLFVLPALSPVAAPLTTGFLAKSLLKETATSATDLPSIAVFLSLSSTATALLMWKAFGMARRETGGADRLHPAWPTLVVAALTIPWVYAFSTGDAGVIYSGAQVDSLIGKLVDSVWPIALAAALVAVSHPLLRGRRLRIPEGDLVVPIERAIGTWPSGLGSSVDGRHEIGDGESDEQPALPTAANALAARLELMERIQRRISVVGLGLLAVGGLLWLLTLWSGG